MFSRSSRKRLSSRSVSVPRSSGADRRAPPAGRERPRAAPLRPAAAHLWPQLTGLGRIERGQPCNACGDQCPGFALHKWRMVPES
ncbi:prickle planar cell polarity protein 3-like [Symphalangus syndactylus]|uniref:prickle planar cell polarity protein 3-like n=1 Tax=Symphalangus syndactylus TaxID=9590 RepID=UPI003003D4ED